MTKIFKESMHNFNYSLYAVLLLTLLIPLIYTTTRIHFLGNIPSTWGFNIASQLAWVNVLFEVIQEGLILPLFFIIGDSINNKMELENKIRTGLIFSFIIYLVLSTIIYIYAKPLLTFFSQDKAILQKSVKYIQLESIAILISVLYRFISVVFVLLKQIKAIMILLVLQMFFTISCDTFLISSIPISRNIGINGVAYSNIIVNIILFVSSIYILYRFDLTIIKKCRLSFSWIKNWLKIGILSGIESFVRNLAFVIMILKMINLVQEQGNFWVANQFIWGWLLLPILALGKLIKSEAGENPRNINKNLHSYFFVTSIIIIAWLLTLPLWNIFIKNVMNITNSEDILHIALLSLIFYIIFAYNNIIDSIFYGIGRTDLMLYQSVTINILYYGSIYFLFRLGLFNPSLTKIIYMFGIGMALDSLITFIMFWYLSKNDRLKDANGIFT